MKTGGRQCLVWWHAVSPLSMIVPRIREEIKLQVSVYVFQADATMYTVELETRLVRQSDDNE